MKPLAQDLMFCSVAIVLGAWLDGPVAWISLQGLCAGPWMDLYQLVLFHLTLAPATSFSMFAATMLCCRGRLFHREMASFGRGIVAFAHISMSYVLMMTFMTAGEYMAISVQNTPGAAAYGGFLAMALFVAGSHIWQYCFTARFPANARLRQFAGAP